MPAHAWIVAVSFLPFVALALAALYVGHLAYEARLARQRRADQPPFDPRAPVEELARLNGLLAVEAREARALLDQARDTLRRGIKG